MVYRLFAAALSVLPNLREKFLDEHCGTDGELRDDIVALLAISDADAAANCLGTGALVGCFPVQELSLVGKIVGRFRLLEKIGEGGMGVVFLAERTDGVQQLVAIKLVSTLLAAAVQQRFEREVHILARLEHPSVARLIDAGVDEGRAWIAIELVRGERIDAYCQRCNLSTVDVVRLLVQLSTAVAAAHAMLVVHNDIKPANVLVTAEGLPKLIDFGIATALRDADSGRAPTAEMGRLFSPNYASSEQVSGGAITVATDVFGLGALGYRLLAGVPIYRDATTPLAYLAAVNSREVDPPSRAAVALGGNNSAARALRGDLDAILCKALERDPTRRYRSAVEFQADLQRYLDGRPVVAHAPSLHYRASKFLRRHALVVGLTSLLGASVIAGAAISWVQSRSTLLAREIAARRGEFLENMLKSANPEGGKRDITVAELLDTAARQLQGKLGAEPLETASMFGMLVDTNVELGRYPEALAASDRQLELLRRAGASPREFALATSARGGVLSRDNRYSEAESTLKSAIDELRKEPGDTAALVEAMGRLAGVYANTNRDSEAESMTREAIKLDRRGTGFPQEQLAVILSNRGRYEESAEYARQALNLERVYLTPDSPTVLQSESTYAMTLTNLHRSQEALPLLQEVSETLNRVLGPNHPDALIAQLHVADTLFDLGEYAKSAAIAHQAAETFEKVLGSNHRYTLGAWTTYAMSACHTDDAPGGLEAARRVADIRARILPPTDWHLPTMRAVVGKCLAQLRRYNQAESMLLSAAADLEASRGAGFFQTQAAFASLRDMYTSMGRLQEASVFEAKIDKMH